MPEDKKHSISPEAYQRYLDGQMTSKERHDFERVLLDDDFANDAFEGLSQVDTAEWSEDLASLKNGVLSKVKRRKAIPILKIAATLLLLGVFSFAIYFLIDSNTSRDRALTKSGPAAEEEKDLSPATFFDSSDEKNDQIIAYQKRLEQEKELTEREISASKRRSAATPLKEEISEQTASEKAVIELVEEETDSEILDLHIEELEPIEPPAIAENFDDAALDLEPTQALEQKIAGAEISTANEGDKKSAAPRAFQSKALSIPYRTITGTVRSIEDDEGIPGVSIIVKGTSDGTVSDIEGNYSISVPDDKEVTLTYSSVGYTSEEVVVGEESSIDVNIEPDITALSEIVVTGYGIERRRDVTGAVSRVELEDDKNRRYQYDPPKPVGGNGAFKEHVEENMRYPASGLKDNIKGTVKLKFIVEPSGEIASIEVLKSLGTDFDNEAIRLLKSGPKWEPANENGAVIAREVKLKIRFRPPE